jgi:hypothetical protein
MRQWRTRRFEVAVDQLATAPWCSSQLRKVVQLARTLEDSPDA